MNNVSNKKAKDLAIKIILNKYFINPKDKKQDLVFCLTIFSFFFMCAFLFLAFYISFFVSLALFILSIFYITTEYNKVVPYQEQIDDVTTEIISLKDDSDSFSESMLILFSSWQDLVKINGNQHLLFKSMANDINKQDEYGNTILHYLTFPKLIPISDYYFDDYDIEIPEVFFIQALLLNANLDIKNNNGDSVRTAIEQKIPEYLSVINKINLLETIKE